MNPWGWPGDSTGWNGEGDESPDFLPDTSPATECQFWGGPYDGQNQSVVGRTESNAKYRFPVHIDPAFPRHVAYYEVYQRDGRLLRYRGRS